MICLRPFLVCSLTTLMGLVLMASPAPASTNAGDEGSPFTRTDDDDDRIRRSRTGTDDDGRGGGSGAVDIADLQICDVGDYDDRSRQCEVDSSGESISSDTLYCTAIVRGAPGDEVATAFLFDGQEAYSDRMILSERRAVPVVVWITLGPNSLPRGDWECEITGDSTETTVVQTTGPTGDFIHAGACDSDDAVEIGDGVSACPRADSTTSFETIESVACSAVLADVADRNVRLEVEYEGTFEVRGHEVDGWSDHETARTSSTVATAYVVIDGATMTGRSGSELPAGRYTCRWVVDGDVRGRRSFTVGETA